MVFVLLTLNAQYLFALFKHYQLDQQDIYSDEDAQRTADRLVNAATAVLSWGEPPHDVWWWWWLPKNYTRVWSRGGWAKFSAARF